MYISLKYQIVPSASLLAQHARTEDLEQAKKLMEMHILRVRRELSEAFIVESDKK